VVASSLSAVQRMQLRALQERAASPGSVETLRHRVTLCQTLRVDEARLDLLLDAWRSQLAGGPVTHCHAAFSRVLEHAVDHGQISAVNARQICGTRYNLTRGQLVARGLLRGDGALLRPEPAGIARVIARRWRARRSVAVLLSFRKMLVWVGRMHDASTRRDLDRWIRPTIETAASAPFRGGGSDYQQSTRRDLLHAMAPAGMHTVDADGTLALTDAGRDYITWDLSKRG